MRRALIILVAIIAIGAFADQALAAPAASFAAPNTATVGVPVLMGVTGTTDCVTNRCQWSWTYRTSGGATLNGGQIGEGAIVTYTFGGFAATKPYVVVKLKVTAPGGTNNYTLATQALVVTA